MKAVYSRWTKPSWNPLKNSLNWHSPKASLLSWVMSVMKTNEYIKDIDVITDEQWAKILDKLWLPVNITTELESIDEKYNWFRALWKIYAYQKQKGQFIHIDRDSRFNKWIPEQFLNAGIFAQNPESNDWFIDNNINFDVISDKFEDYLAGVQLTFNIFTISNYDACDIPAAS